jgi:hypothetical protein
MTAEALLAANLCGMQGRRRPALEIVPMVIQNHPCRASRTSDENLFRSFARRACFFSKHGAFDTPASRMAVAETIASSSKQNSPSCRL